MCVLSSEIYAKYNSIQLKDCLPITTRVTGQNSHVLDRNAWNSTRSLLKNAVVSR